VAIVPGFPCVGLVYFDIILSAMTEKELVHRQKQQYKKRLVEIKQASMC